MAQCGSRMDDREILIRIDRHLDTTSEHMRQGNEYMRQGNELMEANRRAFAETHQAYQDLRIAIREINLRNERVMGDLSAQIRANTESMRQFHREMNEESRAQRGALLAVLNRMGAGPAPEAT